MLYEDLVTAIAKRMMFYNAGEVRAPELAVSSFSSPSYFTATVQDSGGSRKTGQIRNSEQNSNRSSAVSDKILTPKQSLCTYARLFSVQSTTVHCATEAAE